MNKIGRLNRYHKFNEPGVHASKQNFSKPQKILFLSFFLKHTAFLGYLLVFFNIRETWIHHKKLSLLNSSLSKIIRQAFIINGNWRLASGIEMQWEIERTTVNWRVQGINFMLYYNMLCCTLLLNTEAEFQLIIFLQKPWSDLTVF